MHFKSVLTDSIAKNVFKKTYTLARFEPTIFGSRGGCHAAVPSSTRHTVHRRVAIKTLIID
jgi:hypothetical protein